MMPNTTKDRVLATLCGLVALLLVSATPAPQTTAGPSGTGSAISPQGWTVHPTGQQVQLGDRPLGLAASPDGRTLLVSNDGQSVQSLMVIDRQTGTVRQTLRYPAPEALFVGVAFSPDGKRAFASAGGNNKIRVYNVADQQLSETAPISLPTPASADGKPTNPYPAGLAVTPDGARLLVANNLTDALAIVDLVSQAVTTAVSVGHNPYGVVLSEDGHSAYVSNWGEQSVSVVDTASGTQSQTIAVGTHPSAMALSSTRHELYVANTDSDSISVIDTSRNQVTQTISLAPYPDAPQGSSPDALVVIGDSLYVANAGNNDVAVVRLGTTPTVVGLIPTAWYPTAISAAPDGSQLYVVNAKGLGAGPNTNGPNPYGPLTPADQYVGSMAVGTLSIIPTPSQDQLERLTADVIADNGFDERAQVRVAPNVEGQVVPRRPGDASPIRHIVYVIKENRTYDQVFGDLGKGNGDPSLDLFDDSSAPNTRELARRFVLLDNFYADAEVSADGWNWSTAAEANTYVQKTWPSNYSTGRNRPYEFEGGNLATAPGPTPDNAYIWDRLGRAGVAYRNYGFWIAAAGKVASTARGLAEHTDLRYPGYDLNTSDQTRIDEWLTEFTSFVDTGNLPTVELVRLPNDHTAGTRPGSPTPKAYMADNDLALGRLVEAVSTSPYWPETAIFVLEDDAQNGPDHVDAHRTEALIISPYTQTGAVDSTFYSTSSMLRTMELMVGLPPMTQFDAAATPMLNSFTDTPDPSAYSAMTPAQALDEMNRADAPMSAESQHMNFSAEDLAPSDELNAAIWKSVRGSSSEMPAVRSAFR
jgi:YVTN family beta-propeller protein